MKSTCATVPGPRRSTLWCTAFARLDLFVLLACVAGLAALTTAAISNHQARRSVCLNNHRQMTTAWLNYAFDHNETLVGNLDGGSVTYDLSNTNRTWVMGWLDGSSFVPDNTNLLYLTTYSPLAVYLQHDPRPFHCPADTGLSDGVTGVPLVRSIAMNSYMGPRGGPYTSGYRQFVSLSSITAPSPATASLFYDAREDGINDGWFNIDMTGFDPPSTPASYRMIDYPADWHQRAGTVSFVDGHVEVWKWSDVRSMPPHVRGKALPLMIASPGNPDVYRIQKASSRKVAP